MKTETRTVSFDELRENENNPRVITETQLQKLTESLLVFPKMTAVRPIVANESNVILGGNMRYRAFGRIKEMDVETLRQTIENAASDISESEVEMLIAHWQDWQRDPKIEITVADELDEEQTKEFVIKDNVNFGEWDAEKLTGAFAPEKLMQWGVDQWQLPQGMQMDTTESEEHGEYDEEFRVIIVYRKEDMQELAERLGLDTIDRGTYHFEGEGLV